MIHDGDLAPLEGQRVRVSFKDGHKTIGKLQRDLTGQCWELLRADADKARSSPPGVGEILFLQDIVAVDLFEIH